MKKKRTSIKEQKQLNEDSWRVALKSAEINDENWWCMVILMTEKITEHSRCVSVFNAAAEDGKRKAIYSLSYQKTMDAVKVLSNQSLDKCPAIQGVCHYASKILNEDNGVLPTWLMAQVIKCLICRVKEENIGVVKKLADLEKEIDEEYLIMQTVADWGRPKSKVFDPDASKANTTLRKRNEEWRDAIYVDDAPLNGPNLYVILTGFQDPNLPEQLLEAGVPLTCILEIKRPGEQLDRRIERTESPTTRKLQFHEPYFVEKIDLYNFWTTIEQRSMDPEKYPHFCDVAFLTFCPPELPEEFDQDEYEIMKKEMYDSVSYFVYDIYDLHRQHGNYLKSMKVETKIARVAEEVDMGVYEAFLDEIPQECVTVPLVLLAMLMQIEENGRGEVDEKGDARVTETETEPPTIQQKLDELDLKYNLNKEQTTNEEQNPTEIELIQGDPLNEILRLLPDSPTARNLTNEILPIFFHPITATFETHPEIPKKLEKYSQHLEETKNYFDFEISDEEIRHYLHILVLDSMIFEGHRPSPSKPMLESVMNSRNSVSSLKRSKSSSDLTKSTNVCFRSDGNIDYGKIIPTFVECSALFDLIDPRELLSPGYLTENVFDKRKSFEDFNDVESLSRQNFLQILQECLQTFDRVEYRYFEPTDSLLLYFGYERIVDDVRKEEGTSSIRTAVCLRDFNEHVVAEEEDWIRREEELYILQTTESIERLMKKSAEMYDETLLFRDEDFILAGSLKARDLEKLRQKMGESPFTEETAESSKRKSRKISKKRRGQDDKVTGEKGSSMSTTDAQSSSKQSLSVNTIEKETDYEFVGYDLGRLRVQIKNTKETFYSADGTLVRVEMDDWLYRNKDIRITVTVNGYSLRFFERIKFNGPETSKMFHLTSKNGIILAFEKHFTTEYDGRTQYNFQDKSVSFKASWPTGLLIEPIIDTQPDNPFYIRQSYATSRGYGNINGVREVCRKFLRNGTVLKYLDDGKIIVLRPNGVIVICTDFEKLGVKEEDFIIQNDDLDFQKESSTIHDICPQNDDSVDDTMVKVSRYTVLDHDGGCYEVADDLVVNVHHRLLVRTASDYEVDEKFTRRADGTNMLLNSNGELIVEFPDGTRITTGYTIETTAATCDWTEEEITRYFQREEPLIASLTNLRYIDESPSVFDYGEDVTGLLIEDGFVSVLLTCRVEHKNYATVFYDQSTFICSLSMPDEVRVSISGRGDYEVSMADGVDLKIKEDSVTLKGNSCAICGSQSTSTYNFYPFDSRSVIFSTRDVFKNVFDVWADGGTSYRRKETSRRRRSKLSADLKENEDEENFEHRCDHERLCFQPDDLRSRIFSINRDLTAYEYLHRSASNQAELASAFDNETSAILYLSHCRPKLRRLFMFERLKAESRSKSLLTFQYPELKPTNFDRKKLLRSTYSIPYDWPFPFGRNGDGIWSNTRNLPLTSGTEQNWPKLLKIRVVYGFKEWDANAVVDLQRALGRYWMSLASNSCQQEPLTKKRLEEKHVPIKTETIHDYLENNLQNLSLGIIKTIDAQIYKSGLEKSWRMQKTKIPIRSSRFVRLLKETATSKEEFDWYRRCMREGIVLPYFQNITGTCFLWIEECTENAVDSSRENE